LGNVVLNRWFWLLFYRWRNTDPKHSGKLLVRLLVAGEFELLFSDYHVFEFLRFSTKFVLYFTFFS
jgi:hypothetical protein